MLLPISLPKNHQSVCIKPTAHLGCNALPQTDMNVSLFRSWDLVTVKHFVTAWRLEALPPIDQSVFAILTSFGAWRRQYRSTQCSASLPQIFFFFFLNHQVGQTVSVPLSCLPLVPLMIHHKTVPLGPWRLSDASDPINDCALTPGQKAFLTFLRKKNFFSNRFIIMFNPTDCLYFSCYVQPQTLLFTVDSLYCDKTFQHW